MDHDKKRSLLKDVRHYVESHYVPADAPLLPFFGLAARIPSPDVSARPKRSLSNTSKNALLHGIQQMLQPGFRDLLFDFIQKKGIPNVELYRRSDITKAHFSKIKNDEPEVFKKQEIDAVGPLP